MRDEEESRNVEDMRGSSGGGGGFQFRPVHGISLGTVAIALIGGWIFGINPLQILGLLGGGVGSDQGTPAQQAAPVADDAGSQPGPGGGVEDPQRRFVAQILHSTEVVWTDYFQQMGRTYEAPKLILFRDSYPTACGQGQAAAGPFYCPNDRVVYLDMSFFDLMTQQLNAPGQFAHAYVVGHEVGHHVQNLLGILGKVDAQRERLSDAQSNALSVKIELQALLSRSQTATYDSYGVT